jgi:hypothetical protein
MSYVIGGRALDLKSVSFCLILSHFALLPDRWRELLWQYLAIPFS